MDLNLKQIIDFEKKALEGFEAAVSVVENFLALRGLTLQVVKREETLAAAPPAPVEKPVEVEPAPEVKKPALVPTKTPAGTTPARTFQSPTRPPEEKKTPEQRRDQMIAILSSFAGGTRIDVEKTRTFIVSVFQSKVRLEESHWMVFFSALKYAFDHGLPLLDKKYMSKIFDAAPAGILGDCVFGQDGLLVKTLVQLKESDKKSRGLALATIVADAADALDSKGDGLGEVEVGQVKKLLNAVEGAGASNWLTEILRGIVFSGEGDTPTTPPPPATEKIGNGGARIVGDLKKVVKPKRVETAEEMSKAFLEAVKGLAAPEAPSVSAAPVPDLPEEGEEGPPPVDAKPVEGIPPGPMMDFGPAEVPETVQ